MFRIGVKIPLALVSVYVPTFFFMYLIALSLVFYSSSVSLLEESPWYELLIYFLIFIPAALMSLVIVAQAVRFGYKCIVNYFLDAWNDFTVEVESSNVLLEAPFEAV